VKSPDRLPGMVLVLTGAAIAAGSVIVTAARMIVTDAELGTSRQPGAGPPPGLPSFRQMVHAGLTWAGSGAATAVLGCLLIATFPAARRRDNGGSAYAMTTRARRAAD